MQSNLTANKLILPKHFNIGSISKVLKDFEQVFKAKGKQIAGFHIEFNKVEKPSMIGALLLYKIIEYSSRHHCFSKPTISYHINTRFGYALVQLGFHYLIMAFIDDRDNKIDKEFNKLKISIGDKFIIAPKALLREDKVSREEINKTYLPQIQGYYKNNQKAVSMILLSFSEILLNFWEHATLDSKSVIVANGNNDIIEIACADTGEGIISTLSEKYKDKKVSPEFILGESVKKGNTSKSGTNHMGYGLWILDEIVTKTKGRMHIYSQGASYFNEGGKKKIEKAGYWQGTIIYLSLPLHHPKTLEDLVDNKLNTLKINWQ